jgi:hypothetical protein
MWQEYIGVYVGGWLGFSFILSLHLGSTVFSCTFSKQPLDLFFF